jgi:hypothetical protein
MSRQKAGSIPSSPSLTISAALPKRNANTKTDDLKEAHPKTYFSYTKAGNWNMLSRRHCIDYSEQER